MLERLAPDGGTDGKSSRLLFESFEVSNYRAFSQAVFSDLRRFNIIGGMNGVGKTCLLEAMFSATDYVNPIGMMKPFGWKQLLFDTQDIASYLFNDGQFSTPIVFRAGTRDGLIEVRFSYSRNPQNLQRSSDPPGGNQPAMAQATTADIANLITNSSEYVRLDVSIDGRALDSTLSVVNGTQLQSTKTMLSQQIFPVCSYINRGIGNSQQEIAQRFSVALQAKQKGRFLLSNTQRNVSWVQLKVHVKLAIKMNCFTCASATLARESRRPDMIPTSYSEPSKKTGRSVRCRPPYPDGSLTGQREDMIVQDPDDDGAATEQRIRKILSEAGLPLAKHGTWRQSTAAFASGSFCYHRRTPLGSWKRFAFP
jgi:hypothetical protein